MRRWPCSRRRRSRGIFTQVLSLLSLLVQKHLLYWYRSKHEQQALTLAWDIHANECISIQYYTDILVYQHIRTPTYYYTNIFVRICRHDWGHCSEVPLSQPGRNGYDGKVCRNGVLATLWLGCYGSPRCGASQGHILGTHAIS